MLDVADARALITTSLTDEQLETVIAREEAWLARRIGPLDGERVETFAPIASELLWLQRTTDAVVVIDDGGEVDVVLRGWSDVRLATGGASWNGDVEVTYEPNDGADVEKALLTLIRLAVAESAYSAESAGAHSYTFDRDAAKAARWEAWRSLLRPNRMSSLRLTSSSVIVELPVSRAAVEVAGS